VPNSATTHDDVQRMLSEIHRTYSERLTLATLASNLRRRPSYLGRLFREEIGVTVHEYVTRARMVFSAAHVRAGVKIEAVALTLGYRSKKNFYRQFKRFFGTTPDTYRRGHYDTAVNDRAPASRPSTAVLQTKPAGCVRVHLTSVKNVLEGREHVERGC